MTVADNLRSRLATKERDVQVCVRVCECACNFCDLLASLPFDLGPSVCGCMRTRMLRPHTHTHTEQCCCAHDGCVQVLQRLVEELQDAQPAAPAAGPITAAPPAATAAPPPQDFAAQVLELRFHTRQLGQLASMLASEIGGVAAEAAGSAQPAGAAAATPARRGGAPGLLAHEQEGAWAVETLGQLQEAAAGTRAVLAACVEQLAPHR